MKITKNIDILNVLDSSLKENNTKKNEDNTSNKTQLIENKSTFRGLENTIIISAIVMGSFMGMKELYNTLLIQNQIFTEIKNINYISVTIRNLFIGLNKKDILNAKIDNQLINSIGITPYSMRGNTKSEIVNSLNGQVKIEKTVFNGESNGIAIKYSEMPSQACNLFVEHIKNKALKVDRFIINNKIIDTYDNIDCNKENEISMDYKLS